MKRSLVALAFLLFGAGFLAAEEYVGKVKTIAADKLTLTIAGKDQTFDVGKDPLITNDKGKGIKGGVKAVPVGAEVVIFTAKKDGKEEVTTFKVTVKKK